MKLRLLILSLCLCSVALAEQRVIIVKVKDGKPDTTELATLLKSPGDWRVVSATPVQDSDSHSIGKPKQAYTACVIFIVEKKGF